MRVVSRSLCAALVLALLGVGCRQVPVDQGRRLPEAPEGLAPDKIVLTAQHPSDSDRNGYPDTVGLIAYLYGGAHPLPVWGDGRFEFELAESDAGSAGAANRLVAIWRFEAGEARALRTKTGVGPCYAFELSLADVGVSDAFATRVMLLRARFEPSGGGEAAVGGIELRLGSE